MSIRTPLARARGLGSAKDGVAHWWAQRITAVALVPLTLWLVVSIAARAGAGHEAVLAWLSSPVAAVAVVLFLGTLFYHSQLGLQVVVEDYVHSEWLKLATLVVLQFAHIVVAAAAIFAVLWMALT
ncbi:succinate dehydrogenase, hydrophobic membrane anchor protein [Salinisphaera sp. PC39]|uniref:succinate dehydrogenase, hydrophobic membrane anchor protein n=1 Tax=Salinisphaera sp. PC39 TaxID=1304156 RepID=UPI00334120AF